MSVIVILRGPEAGKYFSLAKERTTLGRNTDCDISLPGKQISRQHAHLHVRDQNILLEDLGSSNGTFANGKRLTPHAPMLLTEADTFQIGPYLFGVRAAPPPAADAD
jgi:pSer/pThr/pTyr-binding forkhead associated (FHA) protein